MGSLSGSEAESSLDRTHTRATGSNVSERHKYLHSARQIEAYQTRKDLNEQKKQDLRVGCKASTLAIFDRYIVEDFGVEDVEDLRPFLFDESHLTLAASLLCFHNGQVIGLPQLLLARAVCFFLRVKYFSRQRLY